MKLIACDCVHHFGFVSDLITKTGCNYRYHRKYLSTNQLLSKIKKNKLIDSPTHTRPHTPTKANSSQHHLNHRFRVTLAMTLKLLIPRDPRRFEHVPYIDSQTTGKDKHLTQQRTHIRWPHRIDDIVKFFLASLNLHLLFAHLERIRAVERKSAVCHGVQQYAQCPNIGRKRIVRQFR